MRYHIPAAVLGAAVLLACGQDDARDAQRDVERDTAMMTADTTVTALFVDEAGPDDRLLFVGEDGTIRPAGHEDALFVPLSTFSVERDGIENEFPPADSMARLLEEAGVRGDRFVIVGEPIPSGRAYAGLDYLGLGDRAVLLDGGLSALDAGRQGPADTTRRAADDTAAGGTRTASDATRDGRQDRRLDVDPRDDMIVDAEWVHERLDDPDVAILDARPPAEFSGATPGDGIDRPGHIPGARNVFWQDLVRSEGDTRLKDEAELRRIFEEAGVGPDDTIIAYCRTGGQGSFLYTVARHLGYDVRLYDGSYVDWSRTDYEVER
jgi:thiosulfate/3-mercaptopyruvate sulfurtransferase